MNFKWFIDDTHKMLFGQLGQSMILMESSVEPLFIGNESLSVDEQNMDSDSFSLKTFIGV